MTLQVTFGDAIDWAVDHRNTINAWVTREVSAGRMRRTDAAEHRRQAAEVARALEELCRSVDQMQDHQGFRPVSMELPALRDAEGWLREHVHRMQRWAEDAARKHRTQAVILDGYDGDPEWYKRRRDWKPGVELKENDVVVWRSWGLSREDAEHEVLCSRLALRAVASIRAASEQHQRSGTFPVPSIVRELVP